MGEPRPVAQLVAHVAEAGGLRELRVEQTGDVAPRREGSRALINAVLACELGYEVTREKLAHLAEDRDTRPGWSTVLLHRPTLSGVGRQPPLFFRRTVGRL